MKLAGKTLLVRTDASELIGAGHVMRCLALAEEWQKNGGRVLFVCCTLPEAFERRLRQEGMEIHLLESEAGSEQDAANLLDLAAREKPCAVVVDFYHAREAYLQSLQDDRWKLICIDDNAELSRYPVDFILNQNAHAVADAYASKSEQAVLLLGPTYALLRSEFRAYRSWKREINNPPGTILISMGGGDQTSALLEVINRMGEVLHKLRISVVIARAHADLGRLEDRMRELALDFQILVAPSNMAEELARHDLMISSGGTSVWEALYLQMPALFVVIAENQAKSCRALQALVSHPVAHSPAQIDRRQFAEMVRNTSLREELAEQGRALVDGRGAERVVGMLAA